VRVIDAQLWETLMEGLKRSRLALLGQTVAIGLGIAGAARAAEPTKQELLDRINSLQSQLDEVKTQQQARADKADARDADAVTAAVLKDAQQRSQLLAMEGFTAGYSDGKFLLGSADGNFLLHPWLQFQFRDITNYRENAKANGDNDTQNGFEVRRIKFGFDGNVFSPELTYLFLWATDRHDGLPKLEEAWAKYKPSGSAFGIRAGQFKNPFDHEQIVSSKYQLTVERSLITDILANGDGFVQGVTGIFDNDGALRAEAGFTDGMRSFNTNFQDFPSVTSGNSPPADWGVVGRAEYKFFGTWKEYEHLTPQGNKKELLVVGVAGDFTQAGDTGQFSHTVDVQYATPNSLSIYGAFIGRCTRHNQGLPGTNGGSVAPGPTVNTYDWGVLGQIGFMVSPQLEPYVRYDYIKFDDAGLPVGSTTDTHEITAGVNYYLHGHAAKFTIDAIFLPNGSPVSDDGSGVLSTGRNQNEFLFRGQFQLLL
jgi:hypothetical protein